jgi:glycosyltransferase involved in cell wall biosynthesis
MKQQRILKVCYVTRNVATYRVSVFQSLAEILPNGLTVIMGAESNSREIANQLSHSTKISLIEVKDDFMLGPRHHEYFANSRIVVPVVPSLLSILLKNKPDVVVGDGFFQWTAYALIYRILTGSRMVVCYERTAHTERTAQWYRRLYRRCALRFCGALAINGSQTQSYLESLGVSKERLYLGQMTTDVQAWSCPVSPDHRLAVRSRRFGVTSADTIVFVCVGSLAPRKGVLPLARVWTEQGFGSRSDCALVFVGDGPQRNELIEYCSQSGASNVILVGNVPYEELRELYKSCDILICPTLEDNWSLVVPEAMACGLPVCCSKHNGVVPDLVVEGETGFVFDPCDASSLASALKRAIENPRKLSALGVAARIQVSEFTPNRAAKAIFGAIQKAIEGTSLV